MEAGGVGRTGICARVENKQLIENTTRSKRTKLRIWRIGVRAVYVELSPQVESIRNTDFGKNDNRYVTEVTVKCDESHSRLHSKRGHYSRSSGASKLLDWMPVRRALIIGLALSLIGAGVVPLSRCAVMSSKPADRVTSRTESSCGNMSMDMNMGDVGIQLAAPSDKSCCVVSGALLPESQYKASELSLASMLNAVSVPMSEVPPARQMFPIVLVQNSSPPSFQSLLCTFLI